jgi:protein involved in polysaccharide export with SLBB domain
MTRRFCWVSRLTGFGGTTAAQPHAMAAAFLFVAALASGCSSGIKGADRAHGWYQADSLQQFVADTAKPKPLLEAEYVIGVNDELEVVFPYHTNLTERDIVVRRDGRISLPYVGDQMAAGITPADLDSVLTVKYSEILRDPNLSVIVQKTAPQRVYVLGEVNTPGRFDFDDQMTMVQSIAAAGGFKKGALPAHAVLIRRQSVSKIVGIEVNLKAVTQGAKMINDVPLRNYDIVFIPQHPIFTAADFMEAVGTIIDVPLDAVFKGWQIANLSATYEYFRTTRPLQSTP